MSEKIEFCDSQLQLECEDGKLKIRKSPVDSIFDLKTFSDRTQLSMLAAWLEDLLDSYDKRLAG